MSTISAPGLLGRMQYDPIKGHSEICNYCHQRWVPTEIMTFERSEQPPSTFWHSACHQSRAHGLPPPLEVVTEESILARRAEIKALLPEGASDRAARHFADFYKCRPCPLKEVEEDHAIYANLQSHSTSCDNMKMVLALLATEMDQVMESEITPNQTSACIANYTEEDQARLVNESNPIRKHFRMVLHELASDHVKKGNTIGGDNSSLLMDARIVAILLRKALRKLVVMSGYYGLQHDTPNVEEYSKCISRALEQAPLLSFHLFRLAVSADPSSEFWNEHCHATESGDFFQDFLEYYNIVSARSSSDDPFFLTMMVTFWKKYDYERFQSKRAPIISPPVDAADDDADDADDAEEEDREKPKTPAKTPKGRSKSKKDDDDNDDNKGEGPASTSKRGGRGAGRGAGGGRGAGRGAGGSKGAKDKDEASTPKRRGRPSKGAAAEEDSLFAEGVGSLSPADFASISSRKDAKKQLMREQDDEDDEGSNLTNTFDEELGGTLSVKDVTKRMKSLFSEDVQFADAEEDMVAGSEDNREGSKAPASGAFNFKLDAVPGSSQRPPSPPLTSQASAPDRPISSSIPRKLSRSNLGLKLASTSQRVLQAITPGKKRPHPPSSPPRSDQ